MGTDGQWESRFTYTFNNHFHPYVGELIEQLNIKSIDGLLDANFHRSLKEYFFDSAYEPSDTDPTVVVHSFPKEIDVSPRGPYSVYNWELLFHVPLTIAVHLSKNQRFEDARRWFHYIFDPTAQDGRFWRFLAFRSGEGTDQIGELLRLLSKPDDECSDEELEQKELIVSGYEGVRQNPFQPHVVARTRFLAYQYSVVMKYLDNLIAWGDSLFRQDTMESLVEATQVYVLAANLLGPKPQKIARRGRVRPKTFAQLRSQGIDPLGNALVELEGQFPFNLHFPTTEGVDTDAANPLFGIGRTLYFCIPQNDTLLAYWDTVADRLFKIRHCMNIEGVFRQLPLFEPALDPGMLVKAAAAGIDVSSLVSGVSQPAAPVRSKVLIQKALEVCGEVRTMGTSLLSVLEKQDNEALARLRQKHEINVRELMKDVRYLHWKEVESTTESLLSSRKMALERFRYYKRLLGSDAEDVDQLSLERRPLTEDNFDEVYSTLVEQYEAEVELEEYPALEVLEEGKLYLNRNENEELNVQLPASLLFEELAHANDFLTAVLYYIPNFKIDMSYWGIGGDTEIAGGKFLGNAGQAVSSALRGIANYHSHSARTAGMKAGYERRADEWMLQKNLAALELAHIGRQIVTSLIQEQIARLEYENVQKHIQQAREVDALLRDKFTNAELYGWMQGELAKLYYEYYKLAFDVARQAEQTMKHELMRPELDAVDYVKFNYWDGGRKGLLSGEALHLDLKRMEMAYYEHNKREYELTKHVSLRQLDPMALLALKATGTCEISLPEWLFDLDCPGHYMRRIKSVSLSIPAVTGPYTSVNCTLSLLRSSVRRDPSLREGEYARVPDRDDDRFIDYFGAVRSIVTSHAREDAGLFEENFGDERFLPFEGAGVISSWRLELPAQFRQFDYDTISDVILHIRYTARAGGSQLADKAGEYVQSYVANENADGLVRLFSLRNEFSDEWHRFVSGGEDFKAKVAKHYFPYFAQGKDIKVTGVELCSIQGGNLTSTTPSGLDPAELTERLSDTHGFEISLPEDTDVMRRESEARVFLVIRYSLE